MINMIGIQSYKNIQYDIESYLMNLYSIYVEGNSTLASFQIIVPIAYLLFLSPILLIFQNWRKTIMIVNLILLLAFVALNIDLFNLYGLLIGLTGLSVGLMEINHKKYAIKFKTILITFFCVAIFMMKYFDRNLISYSAGIMIILKLVYDYSKTQNLTNHFNKLILLLGRYSLLSYLVQILFLQIIYRLFVKQQFDVGYEAFIIFVITNIFLILICLLLDLLRSKISIIDKSYKLIFS